MFSGISEIRIFGKGGQEVADVRVTKIGKRGVLVIPAETRRRLGLHDGSLVITEERDDGLFIRPATAAPIDPQRRQQVLAEINQGYAALRADAEAWQAELAQRAAWEATLQDGLEDEDWPQDPEASGGPKDSEG